LRTIQKFGLVIVLASFMAAAPKKAVPAKGRFVDVAAQSTFAYRTENGYQQRKYFVQPMCGGVAVLDYDNDGYMDLYFTNGAAFPSLRKETKHAHALLRNRGDGKFDDVTAKAGLAAMESGYGFGAAAADYDNDGDADLFLTNVGANQLFRNEGNGTFRDVSSEAGIQSKEKDVISVHAAWLDADADGRLDLVVSNYTVWTEASDIRCTKPRAGGGEQEFYCGPRSYKNVAHQLWRNVGEGRFVDVSATAGLSEAKGKGMGIAVADFNGDGRMDFFVANDTERNQTFINLGEGRFEEAGLLWGAAYNDDGIAVSSMGVDARDYDNDGWPDVFFNDLAGQLFVLLRNSGGRGFQSTGAPTRLAPLSRPYSGWSAAFVDVDNDGWKDIYSANGDLDYEAAGAAHADAMFLNRGGKAFEDGSAMMGAAFQQRGFQRGAATVDLNNDGWMDLVVTSIGKRPRILLNQGDRQQHWLRLQLAGRRSNRDAIGAQVKVTLPSGRVMHEHVSPGRGFMSSSDPRLHFGMGKESGEVLVEIRWPSGQRQSLRVMADRQTKVEEPSEKR
jgi:enediyne biosynthesis protein E4